MGLYLLSNTLRFNMSIQVITFPKTVCHKNLQAEIIRLLKLVLTKEEIEYLYSRRMETEGRILTFPKQIPYAIK